MTGQLVGQKLAQFTITDTLGAGGMGVVYRAHDEVLGRTVAIKVLAQHLITGQEARQRFFREARLAAQLAHPNIATVHEIGDAEGQIYIVMEYVEGESLRGLLTRQPLSISQALSYGATLASTVAVAHEAGIVHRDLKPDNVMLDRYGHLKVLDFGIAKIETDPTTGQGGDGLVTEQGRVLGTPGYMSPEQATGKPLDYRTDIFSICVMLYEMLTGSLPFEGSSSIDVIIATSRDEPRPAPEINPQVTPALDGVLRACMAKDPAQRWVSCRALADALYGLISGVSSQELAPTMMGGTVPQGSGTQLMEATPLPAVTPVASGPGSGPVAGFAQGAISATIATAPTVAQQGSTTAGVGLAPRSGQGSRKGPWIGAVAVVLAVVVGAVALVFWPPSDDSVADDPEEAETANLREPKVGLKALASYQNPVDSRAEALASAAMWATAAKDFEDAAEQAGAPARWAAAQRFCEGRHKLKNGKLTEAEQRFRKSISLDEQWAIPHVGLSTALAQQKKHEAAIGEAQLAQRLDPELWIAVAAAARAYILKADFAAAIQEYRRALDMAPGTPSLLAALALAYHAHGLDEPAGRFADQALKADPDMVSARVLLAERALEARDGKLALSHANRAISVEPKNASAWLARGDAYLLLNQRDKARASLRTAIDHYDNNKQRGGPEERIAIVRAALKRGQLPPPRSAGRASLGETRGRTRAPPTKYGKPRQRTGTRPDHMTGY